MKNFKSTTTIQHHTQQYSLILSELVILVVFREWNWLGMGMGMGWLEQGYDRDFTLSPFVTFDFEVITF